MFLSACTLSQQNTQLWVLQRKSDRKRVSLGNTFVEKNVILYIKVEVDMLSVGLFTNLNVNLYGVKLELNKYI